MKLLERQFHFTKLLPLLLERAHVLGYDVTIGNALRCENCPTGKTNSLHKQKLAIDLNLFKDGKFLSDTKSHEPLGIYWESLGGSWGGRFNDGNHYSLEFNGMI